MKRQKGRKGNQQMELMNEGLVVLDLEAGSKEEVVEKIAGVMDKQGRLEDKEGYVADV